MSQQTDEYKRPTTKQDASTTGQKAERREQDRTGGQNHAVDRKRNDEQQYHAAGAAHDPHNQTQQRVDRGDPDAGDIENETLAESAPFNKIYGHHE